MILKGLEGFNEQVGDRIKMSLSSKPTKCTHEDNFVSILILS